MDYYKHQFDKVTGNNFIKYFEIVRMKYFRETLDKLPYLKSHSNKCRIMNNVI